MRGGMILLLTLSGTGPVCFSAEPALPDPTRPYTALAPIQVEQLQGPGVKWRVSGIWGRGPERTALLNGRLVRVGDRVGPAMVERIEPAEVVLLQENQRIVVRLLPAAVKTPVGDSAADSSH
jgi:hypothetical protein